jgi:riboflavin kinase
VRLTPTGAAILRSIHHDLDMIFNTGTRTLKLTGNVTSGLGEGRYYVRQEGYRTQFRRELGFDPYPGTLDIRLDKRSLEQKELLRGLPGKHIEGFATKERTFGPVKCFPAIFRDTKVAVILPARTHLTDIIEVLASKRLRKEFGLEDGDEVEIEVMI